MAIEAQAAGGAPIRYERAGRDRPWAVIGWWTPAPLISGAVAALATGVGATFVVGWLAAALPIGNAVIVAIGFGVAAVIFTGLAGRALGGRIELMRQTLDSVSEALLIAAADSRAVYRNAAFERIFPGARVRPLDAVARFAADDLDVSVTPIGRGGRHALWMFRRRASAPDMAGAGETGRLSTPAGGRNTPGAAAKHAQRFFADAPLGIAVIDRDGRFVEANRALGELFDATPEALVGSELIGWLYPGDRATVAAQLGAAADGRVAREPVEVRVEGRRQRTMMLLFSRRDDRPGEAAGGPADIAAHAADDDADGGLTLYFLDVTEQKSLETQFAQSHKMQAVGQLAGGVAHDFNNLLTAMIGFCDLLLLRSRPSDPAFADIMQIKQNANRAANLVRQLLAFSRQQTLQPRVLDVTDVLVELSHLLRRLIGENITLDVVHGRELGLVKVDQGQLEQVVINLAVNARDAMPTGGRLTIRTANRCQPNVMRRGSEIVPAGDYVSIEVTDTGIGIAPDNLARIFEPFFSTKEIGSGTGLGLSTVYGIVKQTGGFVFVESTCGQGTTFEIYLPRHQASGMPPVARSNRSDSSLPRDLTGTAAVMLVEDDDAVRMFGARALRNKGYRVTEAKSGEAALELIKAATEKFDLLITDVVMPQMDGPSLVREMRLVDPGIKVIFISGYTEDAFRQRLDNDSGIHFLAKPFSLKELAVNVKDAIADGSR